MFNLPLEAFTPNILSICIQPDEGIHLKFEAKVPDTIQAVRSGDFDFHFKDSFPNLILPEPYERLVLDALHGDASLFTRSDGIEVSWRLNDPIIEEWAGPNAPPLEVYEPGGWGPSGAEALLTRNGHTWWRGCIYDE